MNKTYSKTYEILHDVTKLYFDWVGPGFEPLLSPVVKGDEGDSEDPTRPCRFWLWPASANGKHHCYEGGLAQHTLEVMQLAKSMSESPVYAGKIDPVVLATGALWHDIGKIDEYREPEVIAKRGDMIQHWHRTTTAKHGLTHIVTGLMRWGFPTRAPLSRTQHEQVAHLIASHHGRLEWGSPVTPVDAAALILHQADMLSVLADSGLNPQNR